MNRFFLDARTARATWTILAIVGVLGLAYVLRHMLLLAALSLFFEQHDPSSAIDRPPSFHADPRSPVMRTPTPVSSAR